MRAGIYGVTYNDVVVYVGQSKNIQRRLIQHRCTLRKGTNRCFILQRMFDMDPEAIGYVVLQGNLDVPELTSAEQRWMDELKPVANRAKANGSCPHTDEARAKMRTHVFTAEHRANMATAQRGKASPFKGVTGRLHHSEETKAKIAAASRGRVIPFEVRSRAQKGRKFTDEHRAKLSAAKMGRKIPPEVVAKRVATLKRRREELSGAPDQ